MLDAIVNWLFPPARPAYTAEQIEAMRRVQEAFASAGVAETEIKRRSFALISRSVLNQA